MFDHCARAVVGLILLGSLPGCFHVHKHNGKVVKVALQRNAPLARTLTSKASLHLERGELEKAEALLRKAIKANRRYAPAHNNMGLFHFENYDLFRAALAFQEAMRLDPQSPEPQNNLGLVFEAAARPQMALEHYQAAHELSPTDPEFLGNLLRARLRTGDPAEAMAEEFKQLLFIERRPDWIEWIEDQLELFTNPQLDRGPPAPDLNDLNSQNGGGQFSNDADRVIYDSGAPRAAAGSAPSLSRPLPMEQSYESTAPPGLQIPPRPYGQPAVPSTNAPLQPTPTPEFEPPVPGMAPLNPQFGPTGSTPIGSPGTQQVGHWADPVVR